MGIDPANHPVLISECLLNPKITREKTASVLFNKFKVPALYMTNDAQLAMYASGNTTGIMVHIDSGVTSISSVINGYIQLQSIMIMEFGGDDLANYMKTLLKNKGYTVNNEDAAAIIQNLGYVAYDYDVESGKSPGSIAQSYPLAGGQTISVDRERFKAPEVLMQPAFIGMESNGIHEHTYNSIMKCAVEIRTDLYANIVLSGSGTLIPGLKERVQKGVIELAPQTKKVTVKAPANREYLPWTGGKKVASLLPGNAWLSKAVFDDKGASVVHTIFF